jgi:steroid 5-alpha reductase family enzyme
VRSRSVSFVWVTVVYVVAVAAGAGVFAALTDLHPAVAVLIADLVATVVVFIGSMIFRNSSMYDAYWSVIPPFIAWAFASRGSNIPVGRTVLLMLALGVWAIRLTTNWARGWTGLQHEDWRYVMLRKDAKVPGWIIDFSGVHLYPTLQVWVACLAMYPALTIGTRSLNVFDVLGAAIIVLAALVQLIADEQMRSHRRSSPSVPCRTGLWGLSRHPNYFGEATVWWGVWVFGLAGDPSSWWWTLIGPVTMTALLRGASTPMMDKRSLERRPGYDALMRELPAMLPIGRRLFVRSK